MTTTPCFSFDMPVSMGTPKERTFLTHYGAGDALGWGARTDGCRLLRPKLWRRIAGVRPYAFLIGDPGRAYGGLNHGHKAAVVR